MGSGGKAVSDAAQTFGATSSMGPYVSVPAAAAAGIISYLTGNEGNREKQQQTPAWIPEKSPYSDSSRDWFAPARGEERAGPGRFWLEQAAVHEPDKGYVDWSRQYEDQARGLYGQGLASYRPYAMGEQSAAREEAARALYAGRNQVASQAASVSGWRPGTARAALYQQSGMGQAMAGTVEAEALRERQAAIQNYLNAAGMQRQQDVRSQQAEQAWYQAQSQHGLAASDMKARFMARGLDEKSAEEAAQREYQRLMWEAYASMSQGQQKLVPGSGQPKDQWKTQAAQEPGFYEMERDRQRAMEEERQGLPKGYYGSNPTDPFGETTHWWE
jgi:hypothetical protein